PGSRGSWRQRGEGGRCLGNRAPLLPDDPHPRGPTDVTARLRSILRKLARGGPSAIVLLMIFATGAVVCSIKEDDEVLPGKACPCAEDRGYRCDLREMVCKKITCAPGLVYCSGDSCTDLSSDPSNCGTCGKQCTVSDGAGTCSAGQCVVALCEG